MLFHIGTTNPGKVSEIASILFATGCTFKVTDPVNPDETEDDFVGNARLKGKVYARHAGGITISEDSGLLIPALKNLPGPWSARFSDCSFDLSAGKLTAHTPTNTARAEIDRLNNFKVLELMKDIKQPYRAASFKVVLVVANAEGEILFEAAGESHGWISEEMKGKNGFGYDPIFIGGDTYGKTYAELDSMRKNLRSHRKRVLDEFQAWLGQFLKNQPKS